MRHLNIDLILMVVQGLVPPRVLLLHLLEHLRQLCPDCRTTLALLSDSADRLFEDKAARGQQEPFKIDPRYCSIVGRAGEEVVAWAEQIDREKRQAHSDVRLLLSLPRNRRRDRILRARTHFRSRAFVELLLREALNLASRDTKEAEEVARLAPIALDRIPGANEQLWAYDLKTRSKAYVANAKRARGDLDDADKVFVEVRECLAKSCTNDVDLHAEVNRLEAGLRLDQRRLGDAEQLLDRAVLLHREQRDHKALSRALIIRSDVRRHADDMSGAVEDVRLALEYLSPEADPHLHLCALGNLALYFCDVGRHAEARQLIEQHRRFYERSIGELHLTGLSWIEGIVARGLGDVETAQGLLNRARLLYISHEHFFNAALVSLDLALLYLEQGRFEELRRVSLLVEPILRSKGLHREATAALLLFQRAAAADAVTRDSLLRLRSYLEDSRKNPRLRFEEPRSWRAS